MNILILRLSSFGDIVLTFPFINELKRIYPDSFITFITNYEYGNLVRLHEGIDLVIEYNRKSLLALSYNILKMKYDIIFDLHKNIKSYCLTSFTGKRTIRYRKGTLKKLILVLFKINLIAEGSYVYRKYLKTLERIDKGNITRYNTNELKSSKNMDVGGNYVLIAPSSKHFTKRLPVTKYIEIINSIERCKKILVGGNNKTDTFICNEIASQTEDVINYCGKADFSALTSLIKGSQFVICNDSGILHLAEYLNKKVFVFFGSTVKEFGFKPQLKTTRLFENENLKCRPCTHIGLENCPKSHFRCMEDIEVSSVIKSISNFQNGHIHIQE